MKRLVIPLAAAAALALAACGSSSSSTPSGPTPFPRPAGMVAVNFTIDDSANQVFGTNELFWKGSYSYVEVNRVIAYDSGWGGQPFLYDDGPWDQGGHEPTGATAGDHKWGLTVFVKPPAATNQIYEYGIIDNTYQTKYGNGWFWPSPPNGSFKITPGQTTDVTAQGLTIPKFGTIDMKLTLDYSQLTPPSGANAAWSNNTIKVKGSATTWAEVNVTSSAAGNVYSMVLSDQVGSGKPFNHSGLLHNCDKPEWVWVLNGVEYKVNSAAATGGVAAYVRTNSTGAWAPMSVSINAGKNTYFQVPAAAGTNCL